MQFSVSVSWTNPHAGQEVPLMGSFGTRKVRYERLPLLDEITGFEPKDYLLTPGCTGRIPTDGPVYVPASLASAYPSLTKGVITVGDKKLK